MTADVYFLMLKKFFGFSALVLLIDYFLPADLVSKYNTMQTMRIANSSINRKESYTTILGG